MNVFQKWNCLHANYCSTLYAFQLWRDEASQSLPITCQHNIFCFTKICLEMEMEYPKWLPRDRANCCACVCVKLLKIHSVFPSHIDKERKKTKKKTINFFKYIGELYCKGMMMPHINNPGYWICSELTLLSICWQLHAEHTSITCSIHHPCQ